ncbi:MAG: hypothetical protein ACKO6F_06595 [Cyanobium sp.]
MELRRAPQTVAQQFREVHVFAALGAIRIAMLWFSGALDRMAGVPGALPADWAGTMGAALRTPLIFLFLLVLFALYAQLLRGRLIAASVLDGLGIWVVLNLLFHFLKINLLILTDSVSPHLLLGQVITYLMFFVLGWGWIFWRLDRIAGPEDQQIVDVPAAVSKSGSFDYYHASLMSLLEGKMSGFMGVSRLGKLVVAVHTFMILDLAAIALARFYQLVQRSI